MSFLMTRGEKMYKIKRSHKKGKYELFVGNLILLIALIISNLFISNKFELAISYLIPGTILLIATSLKYFTSTRIDVDITNKTITIKNIIKRKYSIPNLEKLLFVYDENRKSIKLFDKHLDGIVLLYDVYNVDIENIYSHICNQLNTSL